MAYTTTPKFKNWRKHETNSKAKELSSTFPVSANKWNGTGMQIEFQNEKGERITFYLPELEKALLLMHIDWRVNGKDVHRADYNLDELEKKRECSLKEDYHLQKYIKTEQ